MPGSCYKQATTHILKIWITALLCFDLNFGFLAQTDWDANLLKIQIPLKIIYVHSNQQHNSNLHFEHTSTWWVSKPFTLQKRHISRRTFNFIHPKQVYSHLLFCSIVCLTKYHSYTSPDLVVYSNIFQLIHDVLVW